MKSGRCTLRHFHRFCANCGNRAGTRFIADRVRLRINNTFSLLKRSDLTCAKVDSDMNIYVGNIKKFTALPGASDDSYAVRVTSVISEEE